MPDHKEEIVSEIWSPALRGQLITDEREEHGRVYTVHLLLGETTLAEWDVSGRRAEWTPERYWDPEQREQCEGRFVEEFLAEKLRPLFAGLEGVITE
jgi:hypothetical protein